MGSGWLVNYLTNRNRRTTLQKELRQKRIALEKIRKICLDEIEKILKSRNNRAITVASRQYLTAAEVEVKETLTTAEEEGAGEEAEEEGAGEEAEGAGEEEEEEEDKGPADQVLTFLVAILCYASYNGIIPNGNISSSIDICSSNSISCLQQLQEAENNNGNEVLTVDEILPCLPGTITSALSNALSDAGVEPTGDNLPSGEVPRSHLPISSLKNQIKLATYNLENIGKYCKKYLIDSVSKESNSRLPIYGIIIIVSSIACISSNYSSSSEVKTCAENIINCLVYSDPSKSQIQACFSDYV